MSVTSSVESPRHAGVKNVHFQHMWGNWLLQPQYVPRGYSIGNPVLLITYLPKTSFAFSGIQTFSDHLLIGFMYR